MKTIIRGIGLCFVAVVFLAVGCSMNSPLGEWIEGTLTSSDPLWYSWNGTPYYYKTYYLPIESGKNYLVELESRDGDLIGFECELTNYYFETYNYASEIWFYTAQGAGEYSVWIKAENLYGSSNYAFRVSEY